MPFRNPADRRRYQAAYNSSHVAEQSDRKQARRILTREVGKAALAGKDVDHVVPLDKGGSDKRSNLRLKPISSNRGYARDKYGNPK